jgi:uncharacterized protein (TIGR02145 family)
MFVCLGTSAWGEEEYLPFIPLLLSGPTYTVTPLAGENGTISPNTPQYVKEGATVSFTLTPDPGSIIDSVGGSCGGVLEGATFTTAAIVADCTVEARFIPLFMVTPSAVGSGVVTPSTVQVVAQGDTISFTLSTTIANTVIGSVGGTCGGSLDDTGTIYTTDPITADCTVVANKVWLDRNLGASRVAESVDDAQAYGDLYQWGRGADGHEKRNSPITSILSDTDTPGHGSFITTSSSPFDWRSSQNDNLWQGVSGINNPCPAGFRLPTESEWQTEINSWSSQNSTGAFNSPLKLVLGGLRDRRDGVIYITDSFGFYWSGTVSGVLSRRAYLYSGDADVDQYYRADGYSVRCLED